MTKLKTAIAVVMALFICSIAINYADTALSGKRFVYNLSQMERTEAYRIVQRELEATIVFPEDIYFVTDSRIQNLLDEHLNEAKNLTTVESSILAISKTARQGIGRFTTLSICIILVVLLLAYEITKKSKRRNLNPKSGL